MSLSKSTVSKVPMIPKVATKAVNPLNKADSTSYVWQVVRSVYRWTVRLTHRIASEQDLVFNFNPSNTLGIMSF